LELDGTTGGDIAVINHKRIEKGLYWDRAWSLVRGCSKVSDGCLNCWAERESHMRSFNPNEKVRAQYEGLTVDGKFNGQIRLMKDNLELPLRVKKPTVWAVWNDLFHESVPFTFIRAAWSTMALSRHHIFMVLTKRPERMKEFFDWMDGQEFRIETYLPHIWWGVTTENQEQANKRIPILLQLPVMVRFVSVEPMLGPVDLTPWFPWDKHRKNLSGWAPNPIYTQGLHWVVCGGESGPGARPMHSDWARGLRDQCVAANVPFFFKQHGEWQQVGECMNSVDDAKFYKKANDKSNFQILNREGGSGFHGLDSMYMQRVGKNNAGRLLDGKEWSEFPEVR